MIGGATTPPSEFRGERAGLAPRVPLRLGFVTSNYVADSGGWWTAPGVGRLADALRERCNGVTFAASQMPKLPPWLSHRVEQIDVVPLPHSPGFARGIFLGRTCRSALREVERGSDVVIVQLPFTMPTALVRAAAPRVYHVYADLPEVVRASRYYAGPKRFVALTAARAIERMQRRLVRKSGSRVVANGDSLLDRYGREHGRAIVSSTLLAEEVATARRSRPGDAPFRILYVGYFRPEKGVDVLVEAFELVMRRVPDAELVLIGDQDLAESGTVRDLNRAARSLGSRVRIEGHVAFGAQLFARYADADVLVLPSRSEGTPRVLIEARAFGCPVIASRVGGVGSSVTDGVDGLLVPPDDPQSLADAIVRVHEDPALRALLIRNGYARARSHTVEHQAEAILAEALVVARR